MTKEIFISNIRSSTFPMYVRAFVASSVIFFVCDIFLGLALGTIVAVFKAIPGQLHPVALLGSIVTSGLWFIVFRGLVGHIGRKRAFRLSYFFFLTFGLVVGTLGFFLNQVFFIELIAQTFLYPFGNAAAGYFLARRRKQQLYTEE